MTEENNTESTQPNSPQASDPEMTRRMPAKLAPIPSSESTRRTAVVDSANTAPQAVSAPQASLTKTPADSKDTPEVKVRRWPWFLLGILLLLGMIGGGAFMGYQAAIEIRQQNAAQSKVNAATEHFMLGLVAQQNKQYALARQQFEYVIMLDPSFPDAQLHLTEVIMAQMATSTPTLAPTPTPITPTPTPDTRSQQQIFDQARAEFVAQDWDSLFLSIDALRTVDPTWNAVQVDGMLYEALRFRGIRKIYQEANLEGGIYDMALAERIAPLDDAALGARNAARAYLNAIAFWGADWPRVIASLEGVYPAMPGLRDGSGMTAVERFRQAALAYANQLAPNDACLAFEYYQKALSVAPDGTIEATATAVWNTCQGDTPTPEFTPTLPIESTPTPPAMETPIPQPTVEAPTVEPPTAEPPTLEAPPTETPAA